MARLSDDGDPSFSPVTGRLVVPARPPLQNLTGTPAHTLERLHAGQPLPCCDPNPCGWSLGDSERLRARENDWEEERRGWVGL